MTNPELSKLKAVRAADVFKAGELAGVLSRHESHIEFRYSTSYLDSGGPPVATTLPLVAEPVRTRSGAVPAFFAGLLPEGRRLTALRREVKTSSDDELSLLLAVGQDTIGDVQVVPQGVRPQPVAPVLSVARDWSEIRFADLLSDAGIVDRVGLPGVQDKVSARMIAVPLRRKGSHYLLKLDPPELPNLVVNEAYFLDRARALGMPVATATVVRDAADAPGLLVTRFDRVPLEDGGTRALACEDACQVLGIWPADKYHRTAEEVVEALASVCSARPVAVRSLFQQLAFAWLTGNGDVHAKNLSVLARPDGEWRTTPAYDLPCTVVYRDTTMALSIGGRTTGLSRRHWLAFAASIGLPERAATHVLDRLLEGLADLVDDVSRGVLPFPQKAQADLVAELRYRRRLMESGCRDLPS